MTDFDTISNKNIVGMALGDLGSGFGSGATSSRFIRDSEDFTLDEPYGQSINNNFHYDLSAPSTSHCSTGHDEDEDSSILSNLPTSCHEFEIKEMHIRLERNASSPLVGGKASPCTSTVGTSGCPSTEPPVDPSDPEDLEVQMINESFEEQQKQTQMYASGDLKTIFYHGGSADEACSSKGSCTSLIRHGTNSKESERLPFTKNLRSIDNGDELPAQLNYPRTPTPDNIPIAVTPPYRPNLFQSLLTPKSEALFSQRMSIGGPTTFVSPSDALSTKRRVSEPCGHRPPIWRRSPTNNQPPPGFEAKPAGHSRHVSFDNTFFESCENTFCSPSPPFEDPLDAQIDFLPPINLNRPDNLCDQTECLATQVAESLFTPQQKPPTHEESTPVPRKCSRRLDMDRYASESGGSTDSPQLPTDIPPVEHMIWKGTGEAFMSESASSNFKHETKNDTKPSEASDTEDTWETMDDDTLDKQLAQMKLEAPSKPKPVKKPPFTVDEFGVVPPQNWDPKFLPHVLEAFNIPSKLGAQDVKKVLEEVGFPNATCKMSGADCALIVFASDRQAMDAQVLHKHQWLKLRSLAVANKASQEAARRLESELRPTKERPRTSGMTARRMVENVLGKRTTVSRETREREKKKLEEARLAKKERASMWE